MGDNVLKACPSIQWFLIRSMSAIRGYTFNLILNSRAISFISYFKWLNIWKKCFRLKRWHRAYDGSEVAVSRRLQRELSRECRQRGSNRSRRTCSLFRATKISTPSGRRKIFSKNLTRRTRVGNARVSTATNLTSFRDQSYKTFSAVTPVESFIYPMARFWCTCLMGK